MKAIVAILTAALIALGGGAIHLWRQLDASSQQIADLKAQIGATTASLHQAAITVPSPSLPLVEPTDATPAAAPIPDGVRREMENIAVAMATPRSPERNAQIKATMVGAMPNEYPDVGEVLGLSRDEVDKLFGLLYDQADRRSKMDPMGRDAALGVHLEQTEKDELASLLGSKHAQWEEYKIEVPTRRHVRDLGAALDAAGTSLSDAQKNSLIQALVVEEKRNSQSREARPSQASSERPMLGSFYRFTPEANQSRFSAALGILTPQQMETYSQMLERASVQEAAARSRLNEAQKYAETLRRGQR